MFSNSPPPASPHLSLRILIIGAGPAGLVLARILQLRGATNVVVIERDPHRNYRPQGGSLDLRDDSGQWALRMAGLHAEFMKLARPEGEGEAYLVLYYISNCTPNTELTVSSLLPTAPLSNDPDLKITDKHLTILHSEIGPNGPSPIFGTMFLRPEIDRSQLRDLLIDSLVPATIQWGTEVAEIKEDPDGGPYAVSVKRVNLNQGDIAPARDGPLAVSTTNIDNPDILFHADLIVGADGAWSRTRSLLTPIKAEYSGISFYDLTLDDADAIPLPNSPDFPTVGSLVGSGMVMALEQNRGIFMQRNSGGRVRIYAAQAVPEDFLDDPQHTPLTTTDNIKAVNEHIASLYPDWSPVFHSVITANTNPVTPRKIFQLPVGHSWSRPPLTHGSPPRTAMITLVGDAAHVMSPFAGEGVNQALADSASLAEALSSPRYTHSLELAVTEYERAMFERVEPLARKSKRNLAMYFLSEDTPAGLAKQMKEYESGWFLIKHVAGKVIGWVMGSKH
ncbi:hypothetical protein HDU93_008833 [Gonapodya sp. JEL0774]|nr:hypothetical protein HDU93_008833 [Gonapodya sp. JEL0774]